MIPSKNKCFCGRDGVGEVTDFNITKYLCYAHWYAHQKKLDDWFFKQYDKQWSGKEWYDALMINRICLDCGKPIRRDLKRLNKKYHCVCQPKLV